MKKRNMTLTVEELAKMSAVEALWECNKDHLDEVAITYRADTNVANLDKVPPITKITYRDLFKNIFKTYNSLKELGVKKGDIVTYASITTPEFIYTVYACLLLGAIFDPLDPRSKPDDLINHFNNEPSKLYFAPEKMFDSTREVYGDLGVKKIITSSFMESLPRVVQIGSKVLDFKNGVKPFRAPDDKMFMSWGKFVAGKKAQIDINKLNNYEIGQYASLAHTTGSTGIPKAILHNHENWNSQLWNISNCGIDFERGQTIFNVTAPWVDFGLINVIHSWLCNGIRMDLDPTWTPEENVPYYLKYRPDYWLGAPGWIDPLFTDRKYDNTDLSFAKYIITGGAPLFEHKQRLYSGKAKNVFNSDVKIVQGYGMSEITAASHVDLNDNAGFLGYPMPIIRQKVVDPATLEEVAPGCEGELWLSSKYEELSPLAVEYLHNPEQTAKTFVTDKDGVRWVRSGDKVIALEDGLTKWKARYKNILTYNGYNIDCDKLLDAVEAVRGVGKGAIVGAVTQDGNQRPVICIELHDDVPLSDGEYIKEDILKMIREHFIEYYEPLDIVIYPELPMKTMKINYNQIKSDILNEKGEYVKPLTLGLKID